MKKYQRVGLTVITFSALDVICASDPFGGVWNDANEI